MTLTCRPAKARGITRRRAPEDLRPFLGAAGKRLEADGALELGAGQVPAGVFAASPENPRQAARDPRDARTARARLLSLGQRGPLPSECAPSGLFGRALGLPAFVSPAGCAPARPGTPGRDHGAPRGGPVGRTDRATRRLARRRAAGWGAARSGAVLSQLLLPPLASSSSPSLRLSRRAARLLPPSSPGCSRRCLTAL